ncbi:hypothetical protein [Parahalioglobus pacificus]|uniref:hypothetical protein n=1 Tax=Parahalioglobus pacificus TaxID=930806 RepID=UPI001E5F451B|nr:hypothetical protein [Halioglobus pacificus]
MYARNEFRLDWDGIHGAPHWARVRHNGLLLAEHTGANRRVVEYFAFIHDLGRHNDGYDPEHGHRAVDIARQIAGDLIEISGEELDLLVEACSGHSDGHLTADVTVMTCWDADRLDLGRVGIRPDPDRLCTAAARKSGVLNAAYERSLR